MIKKLTFGAKKITKSGIYSTTQNKKLMEIEKIAWENNGKSMRRDTMISSTKLTILVYSIQLKQSQYFTMMI